MGDAQPGDIHKEDFKADAKPGKWEEPGPKEGVPHHKEAEKSDALFAIRAAKQEDYNLIFPTIMEGLYYGNTWLPLAKDFFWAQYRPVLEGLFRLHNVHILVMCVSDDPDTIISYLVYSPGEVKALHWVYTKKDFRGQGLASELMKKAELSENKHVFASHMTRIGKKLMPKKWTFEPFYLFGAAHGPNT